MNDEAIIEEILEYLISKLILDEQTENQKISTEITEHNSSPKISSNGKTEEETVCKEKLKCCTDTDTSQTSDEQTKNWKSEAKEQNSSASLSETSNEQTENQKISTEISEPDRSSKISSNCKTEEVSKETLKCRTDTDTAKTFNEKTENQKISTEKFQYVSTSKNFGLHGLENIGNTCYLNAALQSLNHIPEIANYFNNELNNSFHKENSLCKVYSEIVRGLWSAKRPGNMKANLFLIKNKICEYAEQFYGFFQQDSMEFLTYLLSILHDELKIPSNNDNIDFKELHGSYEEIKNYYKSHGGKLYKTYIEANSSLISHLFHFIGYSQTKCKNGHLSIKFDQATFISLPIPKLSNQFDFLDIYDCFDFYVSKKPNNEFYCHDCKSKCHSKTRSFFYNLPKILIIQLKRFKYSFHETVKDNSEIEIYKREFHFRLDLTNYTDDHSRPMMYNLISVTNHSGNIKGGHYYSTVQHMFNKNWYEFNDTLVNEVNLATKDSESCYFIYRQEDRD